MSSQNSIIYLMKKIDRIFNQFHEKNLQEKKYSAPFFLHFFLLPKLLIMMMNLKEAYTHNTY